MFHSHRWSVLWIVAGLLCAGCGGSTGAVPVQPSSSPAPPSVLGRGTLAVIDRNDHRILIFPAQSDKIAREFSYNGANSLTFDRRGHLYIGIVGGDEYFVRELNAQSGERLRFLTLKPSWGFSSIATDDHNVLYVNTKALVGGDVKLFRPEDSDKPYLEIKDPLTPVTIQVARDSLWIGYHGLLADALARYRLRSTQQTWLKNVGNYIGGAIAVNSDGSMIAAKIRRHGKNHVTAYPLDNPNRWVNLHEGDTQALASDDSGHLYIAQRHSRILICTFRECPHSFETHLQITALAWSAPDGMLYVGSDGATNGKAGIYVYNPKTTSLVRYIAMPKNALPYHLAIEP